MPLALIKKKPAKEEPSIFTIIVEKGRPSANILASEIKYLRDAPMIAPDISAKYEVIKM